jgi:hypothetical protein
MYFFEKHYFIPLHGINFTIGLTPISLLFLFLLSLVAFVMVILCEYGQLVKREILRLMFLLSCSAIVFCSINVLIFYIFSEVIVCMFLLITKTDFIGLPGRAASVSRKSRDAVQRIHKLSVTVYILMGVLSSVIFCLFFLKFSCHFDGIPPFIQQMQLVSPVPDVLRFLLLVALLIRIELSSTFVFVEESSRKNSIQFPFLLSSLLFLIEAYSLQKFLLFTIFTHKMMYVAVGLALVVFIKAIVSLVLFFRRGTQHFLFIIPCIKQITLSQLMLMLLTQMPEYFITALVMNYIVCVIGVFFSFFMHARLQSTCCERQFIESSVFEKNKIFNSLSIQTKVVNLCLCYFIASLVGIPGTLGFCNLYDLFAHFLHTDNFVLALCYFPLFVLEVFIMIKIVHSFLLCQRNASGAAVQGAELFGGKTAKKFSLAMYGSVFFGRGSGLYSDSGVGDGSRNARFGVLHVIVMIAIALISFAIKPDLMHHTQLQKVDRFVG